ncbi:MAG TPA: hypothetical protein VHC22_27145 [Pirellulales bacterium]|nr:hypothetical protein [Pirellulales bacterium]
MKRLTPLVVVCLMSLATFLPAADEPEKKTETPDRETLLKQFEESMSGATLVGYFTINGQEGAKGLKEEKYHLKSVKKLKNGDFWLFEYAYGKEGKTISLPVEVKWAGDTPVITLTDVLVPGAGKFTARVLFYRNEYAGTWSASDHGGRLFGKVVREDGKEEDKK